MWSGLFFERWRNCERVTLNAEADGWHYYEGIDGELHAFCLGCAQSEFDLAPSVPPPVPVCPFCQGALNPQPRVGGSV